MVVVGVEGGCVGGEGGVLDKKLGRQAMLLSGLKKTAINTAATLKMMKREQLNLGNRGIRQLKCPSRWACHWVQLGAEERCLRGRP
jgi:hypothetical protein